MHLGQGCTVESMRKAQVLKDLTESRFSYLKSCLRTDEDSEIIAREKEAKLTLFWVKLCDTYEEYKKVREKYRKDSYPTLFDIYQQLTEIKESLERIELSK